MIVNVAFVGHVDHGKSSILGRLLVETGSLPDGKLEQLKSYCQNHAKDFEYAFLTDALEKEQSQGITIDAARFFLRTDGHKFLFIDTPGHLDFLKNMITGSASADIALLIIDAKEGIQENTLRHIFILSFLQIRQVVVIVNKMDQVGYSEEVFSQISDEVKKRLSPIAILPVSAKYGDHIVELSKNMPWYRGKALWESLCSVSAVKEETMADFRMPLQDVYRFSQAGDERRIYCGTVRSGALKKGDRVFFSPSGKERVVATIESERAEAGYTAGFTLTRPIFVERGELISHQKLPIATDRFASRLFWMGRVPLIRRAKFTLRIHTASVGCVIEEIGVIRDSATLEAKEKASRHDIIECTIRTLKPVAFDLTLSQFVLVDGFEIVAAGMVLGEEGAKQGRWVVCAGAEMLPEVEGIYLEYVRRG